MTIFIFICFIIKIVITNSLITQKIHILFLLHQSNMSLIVTIQDSGVHMLELPNHGFDYVFKWPSSMPQLKVLIEEIVKQPRCGSRDNVPSHKLQCDNEVVASFFESIRPVS